MENKVQDWSGKPITNQTATSDILGRWGYLNNVTVKYKKLRRESDRKYYWTIVLNNETEKRMTVSETRAACLNGSLLDKFN